MLRKFFIVTIVLLAIICSAGLYLRISSDPPSGTILERKDQLTPTKDTPLIAELPPLIKEINVRNQAVTGLACNNVTFYVWQEGHRYKLSGKLYYSKPKNFRMQIDSILGREVDVGSNSKQFWYWSRRDKNPGLHFASHDDLGKTRLKTPFNPMFLRTTLGFEILPNQDVKIIENQTDIMLVYPRKSATGEPLLFSVFINKAAKRVDGYVITNSSGRNIASCEIQQYDGDTPVKILYSWYEEERAMLMLLNRPQVNAAISDDQWQMPNYTPKIDMSKDF